MLVFLRVFLTEYFFHRLLTCPHVPFSQDFYSKHDDDVDQHDDKHDHEDDVTASLQKCRPTDLTF